MSTLLWEGPEDANVTMVLAHGANAPMDSPFMDFFAHGLTTRGYRVGRFEFPYMARRREDGRKRPPDRAAVLADTWRSVVRSIVSEGKGRRLVIGGKSLGGRIASMIAGDEDVHGLICLGYPFHPPQAPQTLRVDHLLTLTTPTLIVQGTRDPFGLPVEIMGYGLRAPIELHWIDDGDHGFRPRKSSGRTEQQNLDEALAAVSGFIEERRQGA